MRLYIVYSRSYKNNLVVQQSDNPSQYAYNGHSIEFMGVSELCMGCPDTGRLVVDGVRIGKDIRFGTNVVFYRHYLIVPRYKRFWSRFKLCAIDLHTKKWVELGRAEPLAMPIAVERDTLYYQNSLYDTAPQTLSLAGLG
jgi:hypothetical protein